MATSHITPHSTAQSWTYCAQFTDNDRLAHMEISPSFLKRQDKTAIEGNRGLFTCHSLPT